MGIESGGQKEIRKKVEQKTTWEGQLDTLRNRLEVIKELDEKVKVMLEQLNALLEQREIDIRNTETMLENLLGEARKHGAVTVAERAEQEIKRANRDVGLEGRKAPLMALAAEIENFLKEVDKITGDPVMQKFRLVLPEQGPVYSDSATESADARESLILRWIPGMQEAVRALALLAFRRGDAGLMALHRRELDLVRKTLHGVSGGSYRALIRMPQTLRRDGLDVRSDDPYKIDADLFGVEERKVGDAPDSYRISVITRVAIVQMDDAGRRISFQGTVW